MQTTTDTEIETTRRKKDDAKRGRGEYRDVGEMTGTGDGGPEQKTVKSRNGESQDWKI